MTRRHSKETRICRNPSCEKAGKPQPIENFDRMSGKGKSKYRYHSCRACRAELKRSYTNGRLTPKDLDIDLALRIAQEQGRIDGSWECPICGMKGYDPPCPEGDCAKGVAEYEKRMEKTWRLSNEDPREYRIRLFGKWLLALEKRMQNIRARKRGKND